MARKRKHSERDESSYDWERFTVPISKEDLAWLRSVSKKRGKSVAYLIRKGIGLLREETQI